MQEAVIIDCVRTPVGKAPRGSLRTVRPDDLAAIAIRGLLGRFPDFDPAWIDDVIMGCANPEAESGSNIARIAALRAGLPDTVPAVTINRFCSSGLQSIAMAAEKIRSGGADIVIAGGAESMSMLPFGSTRLAPNPWFVDNRPEVYINMGLTAENLQKEYGISREEQDAFSLRSHQKALAAQAAGHFDEEIIPVDVTATTVVDGKAVTKRNMVAKDEGPRADTTAESLGGLRPAFDKAGTITAGNASQISDGGCAVVVMSRAKADELGVTPLGELVSYGQVAGPDPSLLSQPSRAISAALAKGGLALSDIDLFEINEAFAAVGLRSMADLGISDDVTNVNGGAIALGHPVGMSGTRVALTALYELKRRGGGTAAVSLCGGGGQGDAAVLRTL